MVFLFPHMNDFYKEHKRIVALLIVFCFLFEQTGFAQLLPASMPAASGIKIPASDTFRPVHLRSIDFNQSARSFSVFLDKGDFKGSSQTELEQSIRDMMMYFFIGLRLPNSSFWVNLRPDSPDRIIDDSLAKTDTGRIMLAADVQLKKDLAAYTSPKTKEGREYWDKLYKKAEELFGNEDISIPTITRPWIVPNEIILRDAGTNAYIYKATLKVLLESDYLKDNAAAQFEDSRFKTLNDYSSQIIKESILPKLSRDVNISKRYAPLRQVYYSLILAQWFKSKKSGSADYGIDIRDLTGLTSKTAWTKDSYFKQYQESFRKGEYNIQDAVQTPYGQTIRQYFSGGIQLGGATAAAGAHDASVSSILSIRADHAVRAPAVGDRISATAVLTGGNIEIHLGIADNTDLKPASGKHSGAPGREGLSTVEDIPSTGASVSYAKDGGRYAEQIEAMWEKFSELYVSDVHETFVAGKLRSVGKTAVYLPTLSIREEYFPEGYSTAGRLRPSRDVRPLPQKLESIERVAVIPVKHNGGYVVPYSYVNNGSMAVVLLGQLSEDKTPVVLKTYPGRRSLILQDYQGAQIADDLGIGPRVYGIYVDSDGREWTVTDLVPGDFPEALKQTITQETVDDFTEMHHRLRQQSIYPYYDFQYFITPNGRIWVIDPISLVVYGQEWDLVQYSQEYKSDLEKLKQQSRGPKDGGAYEKAQADLHDAVAGLASKNIEPGSAPVVDIDFWADDYVDKAVAAIRNKQAMRLDLNSNDTREFLTDSDISAEFFHFASDISSACNDINIVVPLKELLKNAFCHGHKKNFDLPIYIILAMDEFGKMEQLQVFNIVASQTEGSVPGDGVQKPGARSLHGNGEALSILEKDWDYSREYVAHGLACKASITRKAVIDAGLTMWDKRTALAKLEDLNAAIRRGKYQHGMVVEVPPGAEVILVGDLHAKLDNLKKILNTDNNYQKISRGQAVLVLLGDMVHGEEDLFEMDSSVLTMQFIMELKIRNPDSVYMLMGNHDYLSDTVAKSGVRQGAQYKQELLKRYGEDYVQRYQRLFLDPSPLMASGEGFLGVHAGPIMGTTVEELRATGNTHELSDMAQEATQGMWGSTYDRSYVQEYLAHHGQPDGILLIGHMPVDTDDWHWPQWDGRLHIIYGANRRVGYASAVGGRVSYKEVTENRADFSWDRSIAHDGGAPAGQIIAMFGLNGIDRTSGITVSQPRTHDGYYVRRATFAPDVDLSDQLKLLKHELYAIKDVPFDSIDLVYNLQDRLIAVFPVITPYMAGAYRQASMLAPYIRYLNLAYYYHVLPQIGDYTMLKKWRDIVSRINDDMYCISSYKKNMTYGDLLREINEDKSPYIYVEIDRRYASVRSYELLRMYGNRVEPLIDMVMPLDKDPAKYQAVLPVFPTVYSPAAFAGHDRDYYLRLCRDFDLRPGHEALVVGPGVGLEAWLASLKTRAKVSCIGINPFEVANLIYTSRIADFQVEAIVGDNIITPEGNPRFKGRQFDRVIWNMPAFRPAGDTDHQARAAGRLESYWDGDFGGVALERFAKGLLQVLKPEGQAIVWNEPSFIPTMSRERIDRVGEMMKLDNKLHVIPFHDYQTNSTTYKISLPKRAAKRDGGADFHSPRLWDSFTGSVEQAALQIKARKQSIDYRRILGENRVLFLGLNHFNFFVAEHVTRYARYLKELGITHYAIEAQPNTADALARLNRGEGVDLSSVLLCPEISLAPQAHEAAARAFAKEGIIVVPVDMDLALYRGEADREEKIYNNIKAIIEKEPNARIAVLIGAAHASKSYLEEEGGSVRVRLNRDNITTSSVCYTGGLDMYPQQFLAATYAAGAHEEDFVIHDNADGEHNSFSNGEFDHIIYLGQSGEGAGPGVSRGPSNTGGIDLRSLCSSDRSAALCASAAGRIRQLVFKALQSAGPLTRPVAWNHLRSNDTNYIQEYMAACVLNKISFPREEIISSLALKLADEERNDLPSDPAALELLAFVESGA